MKKIKIAVSACLLGQNVRYDGGNKFIDLSTFLNPSTYELKALCPEVEMGLATPRQPIHIIQKNGLQLMQVNPPHNNLTQQMEKWFHHNKKQLTLYAGFVLKSKSPSCGHQTTLHYKENNKPIFSDGIFVYLLKKLHPTVVIIDEIDILQTDKCAKFLTLVNANQK